MYTQCPECLTIFKSSGAELAATLGSVRCGHCSAVFDALRTLTEQLPPEPIGSARDASAQVAPPQLGLPVFRPNPGPEPRCSIPKIARARPSARSRRRSRGAARARAQRNGAWIAGQRAAVARARRPDRLGRTRALARRRARARLARSGLRAARLRAAAAARRRRARAAFARYPPASFGARRADHLGDRAQRRRFRAGVSDRRDHVVRSGRNAHRDAPFSSARIRQRSAHDRGGARAGRDAPRWCSRSPIPARTRSHSNSSSTSDPLRRVRSVDATRALQASLLHRRVRKRTQVPARTGIRSDRSKNLRSWGLSSRRRSANILSPCAPRMCALAAQGSSRIQRGHPLVNAVSVLRADAAHEPRCNPRCANVSRAQCAAISPMSNRSRAKVCTRWSLHEVESPLLARSAGLVRRQPEQGRGRARHQPRDAAQEAAPVRPRRLTREGSADETRERGLTARRRGRL